MYIKEQKNINTFVNTFLSSLAIQITTLPIILYFYYEFPLYGVFINIIVIPLASLLVIVCAAGGIVGLIFLPLAKFILGASYILLNIYETVCTGVSKLPYHMVITGKPDIWQIVMYFAILTASLIFAYFYTDDEREEKGLHSIINPYNIKIIFLVAVSVSLSIITFVNTYTKKHSGLKLVFLDIGQGDAIFMQDNSGTTYLVDGGSSSVKQVGKYRIIPYLKCNGISSIDYMIMTHSDKDHISGLKEILQQQSTGIKVANLLLPNPASECKEEAYYEIMQFASKNGVNTDYIEAGDIFLGGDGFSMQCLHPEPMFNADSANSYSTTLSIVYGNTSFLLTGDIEGNGEEALLEKLNKFQSESENMLPIKYNVLKVAHHGSKNSTSDAFLERVSPDISIISCGKNNMYGHPHKELLERLQMADSSWIATKDVGAITVFSNGDNITVQGYKNNTLKKRVYRGCISQYFT